MSPLQPTAGDEVLQWASEVGSGSWNTLQDGILHVCRKHEVNIRPATIVNQLSNLGHLDMDWDSRRWSIAKPALNIVPNLGLCAILTGSRPHFLLELFNDAANNLDVYPIPDLQQPKNRFNGAPIAPSPVIIKCVSLETAKTVAGTAKIELITNPAESLSNVLPDFSKIKDKRASPPGNLDTKWFCPKTRSWEDAERKPLSGLHRIDIANQAEFRWNEGDDWWHTDLSTGQFLAVQETTATVFKWTEGTPNRGVADRFEVLKELRLPSLAMRTATICDGFLPEIEATDNYIRFLNVPLEVAKKIAHSVGHNVSVS
jgi:hypothetical protein